MSWRLPSIGSEIQEILPTSVHAICTFIPVVLCFSEYNSGCDRTSRKQLPDQQTSWSNLRGWRLNTGLTGAAHISYGDEELLVPQIAPLLGWPQEEIDKQIGTLPAGTRRGGAAGLSAGLLRPASSAPGPSAGRSILSVPGSDLHPLSGDGRVRSGLDHPPAQYRNTATPEVLHGNEHLGCPDASTLSTVGIHKVGRHVLI